MAIYPAAAQAISVLQKIQTELDAAYLAYFALPNTVLTLSGVRPYADGVFWDNDGKGMLETWKREITLALDILAKHTDVIWSQPVIEEVRPGETYAGYEMILAGGLQYMLKQTEVLRSVRFDELAQAWSMPEIQKLLFDIVRSQESFSDISDENIHHFTMGLLLGYPDTAIVESVKIWDTDDPFSEPLIPADIRGASFYLCPQPVYDYPRHLVGDPAIIAHEKLWSKILHDFYTSDFHRQLAADKGFMAKMAELHNLR